MSQSPYREARRVFWIMDNGSSHRGEASVQRLRAAFPTLILVHGPIHASWLNQIEIYFSILQRKVLTPNDFSSLADVEDRLLGVPAILRIHRRAVRMAIHQRRPRCLDAQARYRGRRAAARRVTEYVAELMNRST